MSFPSFVRFFRQQSAYIAVSAVIGAIFWANGQRINPGTVLLYSICIGNFETFATDRLSFLFWGRPFPYNWLIFIPLLLIIAIPVYMLSSVVVWLIVPPTPQTLFHLLRTGWKLPYLVIFVFGVLSFLYHTAMQRLEKRNIELLEKVELGSAQIEMQEQEMERAREIQQSLLPHAIPQLAGFEVAGAWRPARTVSGDYYDVLRLGEHRLGICIADVAGKGVSAALLMANVQAAVRAYATETESPASLCVKVNELLHENIAVGKFVTFIYGILDGETRTFRYCNAGHLYPILVCGHDARSLDQSGAVLGVFPRWKYEDATAELGAGDRLLLFTDGISEAVDAGRHEFEETNIAAFACANIALSAADLNGRLLARVTEYCGAQFEDDATLMVIAAN